MERAWFEANYKDHHLAQVNTLAKNIMFHFHGNDLLWPLLSVTLGNMKSLSGTNGWVSSSLYLLLSLKWPTTSDSDANSDSDPDDITDR